MRRVVRRREERPQVRRSVVDVDGSEAVAALHEDHVADREAGREAERVDRGRDAVGDLLVDQVVRGAGERADAVAVPVA